MVRPFRWSCALACYTDNPQHCINDTIVLISLILQSSLSEYSLVIPDAKNNAVNLWPTFTELYTVIRMLYGAHSSPKPAAYHCTGWYWYARLNQVYDTAGSRNRKSAYLSRYGTAGYIGTQCIGRDYRLSPRNLPFYCLNTTFRKHM